MPCISISFDFIYGAYGIKAAAETYFGKEQDELSVEEAATLIGMLQNPVLHNPIKYPKNAEKRRMIVLNQMVKNELLTKAAYDSLRVLPINASLHKQTHDTGPAPYFRLELGKRVQEILAREECLKPDGTKYNAYKDGLKIYTTIDLKMQEHFETAMMEHMPKLQERFLEAMA